MADDYKTENAALTILRKYHNAKLKEQSRREVREKCFAYVNNWVDGQLGQWTKDVRSKLGDKPALSFNEVRKFVNRICGALTNIKMDEKLYPQDDQSDWILAEINTDLIKFVKQNNEAEDHIARALRDGVIGDSGYIKVEFSDEFDPLGDIVVKRVNPSRVYILGDAERLDLLDADGIIEELPMTYDELVAFAPDKEDEIRGVKDVADNDTPVASDLDYLKDGLEPRDVYDKEENKYIVLRCQKYEYKDVFLFKNNQTGELVEAPEDETERQTAAELAATNGIPLTIVRKRVKRVKIVYVCGHVVLKEYWSPYKHNRFDIARFCPYLDNGQPTGVVQDLLDPQDEKNKRRSQLVHILNTTAKNSYFYKEGAIANPEEARKRIGQTGELIPVQGNLDEVIRPIESNLSAVPALVNLELQSTQDMKEISGLHDAALGQVPQGVKSGRGIQQLQLPAEAIVGEIVRNYIAWRKRIASMILALIQQYYTDERRVRILGDYYSNYIPENAQIKQLVDMGLIRYEDGAKIITINKQTLDGKLNDVSVGKYDVVIDVVAYNPTTQRAKYLDLLNMKALGAPVRWSTILKNSDVKGKQELLRDALEAESMMSQMGTLPQIMPGGAQTPNVPIETDLMGNMMGARQ